MSMMENMEQLFREHDQQQDHILIRKKTHTDQVEHSVGVSCEFGNLSESWIFPHQDLVLRIAMSAHLQKEPIL